MSDTRTYLGLSLAKTPRRSESAPPGRGATPSPASDDAQRGRVAPRGSVPTRWLRRPDEAPESAQPTTLRGGGDLKGANSLRRPANPTSPPLPSLPSLPAAQARPPLSKTSRRQHQASIQTRETSRAAASFLPLTPRQATMSPECCATATPLRKPAARDSLDGRHQHTRGTTGDVSPTPTPPHCQGFCR